MAKMDKHVALTTIVATTLLVACLGRAPDTDGSRVADTTDPSTSTPSSTDTGTSTSTDPNATPAAPTGGSSPDPAPTPTPYPQAGPGPNPIAPLLNIGSGLMGMFTSMMGNMNQNAGTTTNNTPGTTGGGGPFSFPALPFGGGLPSFLNFNRQ